jgi:restriction system protein
MARRKKSSPAEDVIGLVAMMPWWGGCGLAVVFYVMLHRVASHEVVTSLGPTQAIDFATQGIGKTLATFGQYLLPFLCLCGAAMSAYGRSKRQKLMTGVLNAKSADALNTMSWQEFELLVGEGFRQQGYQVTENGGGGADGGIDLVLRKGGDKFLVQCKQWKAFTVGVTVVRELYGLMAAHGAAGGFVVTSGTFTAEAKSFASGRNLTLLGGPDLVKFIKRAQTARTAKPATAEPAMAAPPSPANAAPACPACGKLMVKRTAKRGGSSGSVFWGCSAFPACKGTRPAA